MNIVDQDQRDEAATRADVNLVITAGAGTGKTSLLIERILHDLLEHGTSLDRIAAITFTEKAAAEMRERLEEALEAVVQIVTRPDRPPPGYGEEAPRVLRRILDRIEGETVVERSRAAIECLDRSTLSTIHSFCAELLRRHPGAAGVDPEFEIDQGEAERTLLDELWVEHLREVFGDPREDEEFAAWRRLLERYSMAELEEIARPLCRFGMPESVLDSSDPDVHLACLKAYAVERRAEVESLRQGVEGAAAVRKEFIQTL